MRSTLRSIAVVAAVLSLSLRADIITLTDGRTVEGEIVSETPTEIVVKATVGKTTIKREEIQSIEKRKSASLIYREKIDALDKSKNNSLEDWLNLANEASAKGARDESLKAYKKVVALDPENAVARKALGFVRSGGQWVDKNEVKEKAADGKPAAGDANAAGGGMTKDKIAAATGLTLGSLSEKPVNCPRCNGTGVWIMLTCLNCNKSDKPGYKNLGDHYEMDQRCGGTGKVIGAYCELCNRTGKVMLSHITPANGGQKPPPSGKIYCPVCNGTGVEKYLQCLQCKRSKWPGYLFMGDQVIVCNSCGGAGKKVGLECANCNHTGLVNATNGDPNKQFGIGVGAGAQEKK